MEGKLLNNSDAMNSYMVDIDLPELLSNEFIKLIPKQRSFVKKMMSEGVISNYSLSFDRKKLWVVINADTPLEAKTIVESFPIYNHIKYKINSLLFHETNITSIPHMWLN
jgi:hypothetical protein